MVSLSVSCAEADVDYNGSRMELPRRDLIGTIFGINLAVGATYALPQDSVDVADPRIAGVKHRYVQANGIKLHLAEQGAGPLVILCHGFPESWYSWRNQFAPLANAGFRVAAPDMRGYGKSERPHEVASYDIMQLVGDIVGIVQSLGEGRAIIIGHDWGATVAWHAALLRPDLFAAVAGLSVPFRQRGTAPPLRLLRQQGLHTYYWLYYQDVGVADAEYDRDIRESLRRTLFSLSGDAQRKDSNIRILKPGKGVLDNTINPEKLPAWLTEADVDYMTADMTNGGFRGGLNWYRNIDRNWELLAPWAGAVIQQSALFIAGSEDHIINGPTGKTQMEAMKATVPNLQRQLLLEGAGHFVQQERPQVVNEELIQFLRRVSIR